MLSSWTVLTLFRRRHARSTVAMVSAFGIAVAALVSAPVSAGASVGSDRAQISQLEQQISDQGAHVESLVARYNAVQGRIGALQVQITRDRAHLAVDQHSVDVASVQVRDVAVQAYMNGVGMNTPALAVFSHTSDVNKAFEQNNYLSAANSKLNDQVTALGRDQDRVRAQQRSLRSAQARAEATLRQLDGARRAANSAIAADQAMLSHVNGNLKSLLAAAQARADAAQRAAERALATAPSSPPPSPPQEPRSSPVSPPPPTITPTPGTYANPLRAVGALSSERIDQGVDYSGFGPIYAIGDGVVLSTVNGGWPGGTFIAYRLTDGPAQGLVVYAAEDIEPAVQIGATVSSNTVLGQVYAGPTGIEIGWADPSANGDTMARTYQQYNGGNSTAFGFNFSQLLQSLGAPGGVLETNPPTGTLPPSWPRW